MAKVAVSDKEKQASVSFLRLWWQYQTRKTSFREFFEAMLAESDKEKQASVSFLRLCRQYLITKNKLP